MLEDFLTIAQTGTGSFGKIDLQKLNTLDQNQVLSDMLHSIMVSHHIDIALYMMEKAGILSYLIPGFDNVVALSDNNKKRRYKDLWPHTKKVVAQSAPTRVIRWSALFHDFGKPDTFKIDENNVVTFHGHEHLSVKFFKTFANKWKIFSKEEYDEICYLIYNLGYVESYLSEWTESAVRRFAKETSPYTENLILLSSADITTSYPHKKQIILDRLEELKERIKTVQAKDAIVSPLPKGIGHSIISMGIGPGEIVGKIKAELESKIANNEILANQEFSYYQEFIKEMNMNV